MKELIFITNKNISNNFIKFHQISKISNQMPNLFEILFSKNIFLIDNYFKRQKKLSYLILKLLNKSWNYHYESKKLIENLQNKTIENIFISPMHFAINEIYSLYYRYQENTVFIKLPLSTNSSKTKREAIFLGKKLQALKSNTLISNKKILCGNLVSNDFIQVLLNFFEKKQIYIRYYDMIGRENIKSKINFEPKKLFLEENIETYSKLDAQKFNIKYQPNFINFNTIKNITNSFTPIISSNYISFVGSLNNHRFFALQKIVKTLSNYKIKFIFYIPGIKTSQQEILIKECKNINNIKIHSNSISYFETVKLAYTSLAIIDLYRITEDEGYPYRIAEIFGLNRKLITNRAIIQKEQFYNNNNILIINETYTPNQETIEKFLTTKFKNNTNFQIFNKQTFIPKDL